MELVPHLGAADDRRMAVKLLAPLAPHLAEELWAQLGGPYSVHTQPWPEPDLAALRAGSVTIVVQVDGRVRGRLEVEPGVAERVAVERARGEVVGVPPPEATMRVVFVPDRVLSFVTS
jgi:leucyl-tRNA synthetase